jgi:hypothetical protein
MKRTALMRKTPLRAKTPLKAKTGLKSYSQLKTKTPLKSTGTLRQKKPMALKDRTRKLGVKSTARLKKELDSVFSQYVRWSRSENGCVQCYTCREVKEVKKMQNGHFVSRGYLATRFDEDNCRPQCYGCNMFGEGRILDYEERLIEEIGQNRVTALKLRRHLIVKYDEAWYLGKIKYYKSKLKNYDIKSGHAIVYIDTLGNDDFRSNCECC